MVNGASTVNTVALFRSKYLPTIKIKSVSRDSSHKKIFLVGNKFRILDCNYLMYNKTFFIIH